MVIPSVGIDGRESVSTQITQKNTRTAAPGSFQAFLTGKLEPDSGGKINEEQLFAALISERLMSTKGAEAAQQFEERYQLAQADSQRADGYIFLEDSARTALKSMNDEGILSLEEAESIHAQAFQGAQLDDNKNALYDSFGSTMAVAMIELAISSAESEITKFDQGTTSAGRLSLDLTDLPADKDGAITSATGENSEQSEREQLVSGAYSDGLIWKPSSDSNGDVAIILNSSLKDKIGSVALFNANGNRLEETSVNRTDDKGRSILFFDRPGKDYPDDMTVQVVLNDGRTIKYRVPDPSNRIGY